LEQFPAVGCTGGLVKNIPMNAVSEIIAMAMASEFGVGNVRFRTGGKAGYVDTVAFGAYRREVFEKVGLFDERLVRNQDDEMNFRLTEYGYKIYFEPGISSNYYVRGSWKGLIRQYYQYGYWKVCVNVMHRKITTWRQLVPFIFVMFVIFGALGSAFLPFIFPMYIAGLGVYFAGSVLSSIRQTSIPIKALKLMFAFFVLHASYGFGFAEGLCWFAILGRKPHQKTFRLSR
jgi:GT2 family glycosyltransferase